MASTGRPARVSAILSTTDPCSPLSPPLSSTALILMDYHNFIFGMIKDPDQQATLVTNVNSLLKWAREQNLLVVHALIDPKKSPAEISKMRERWPTYQQMFEQNPSLTDLYPEFAPVEREVIVTRTPGLVSVLESDGLKTILEHHQIKSLVMAGVSTSGCTLSTARASSDQGFITTVVEDCCWDPNEGLHEMLIQHVLPATVHVIDTKTWIGEAAKMKA